jgi:uncharacterized protein
VSTPADGARKRCTVVYALRERQFEWSLELPADASIGEALTAARRLAGEDTPAIPWDSAAVGVFGVQCRRADRFHDGDRIELYRPLRRDPRERRRERVQRERRVRR